MTWFERRKMVREMVMASPDPGLHATASLPPDIADEVQEDPKTRKTYEEWRFVLDQQFPPDTINRYEAIRRALD